jgi:hypothetical protein
MQKQAFATAIFSIFSATFVLAEDVKPFVIVTVTPTGTFVDPKDNPNIEQPASQSIDQGIIDALNNSENLGTDTEKLARLISTTEAARNFPDDIKDRIEAAVLGWTKPLPASALEKNMVGYTALSNIRPDAEQYSSKREKYKSLLEESRRSVLKRFRTQTDDFSGITFYTHQNIPKYIDTRSYVALYLGKRDGEPPFLRLKVNYTSDNWLFIETAEANIDGEFLSIPASEWQRDNDSEIWEWIDVLASGQYLELAKKIAVSEKTVIRFNGQQYHDNYIVKNEDKEAIRDALLAYDVLLEGQN